MVQKKVSEKHFYFHKWKKNNLRKKSPFKCEDDQNKYSQMAKVSGKLLSLMPCRSQ